MDSIARPLRALAEDAAWFTRNKTLRLLHVVAPSDLRESVIGVVMGQEFHADNLSPFLRLEDAYSARSQRWEARALRVREQHAARCEAMAKEGQELPALPPLLPEKGSPLTAFAVLLRQVVDARCPPLDGLVVVLAPTRVEDARDWQRDVRVLLDAPRLSEVRWVVVEPECSTLDPVLEALGGRGLSNTCQVDEEALQEELGRMLDAASGAAPDAPGPAQVGAAWPRGVVPPRRIGQPSPSPDRVEASLKELGIAPGIAGEPGRQLRQKVLLAAQALRKGKVEAIRLQREARDLCLQAGLTREALLMDLVLAGYLTHLKQPAMALEQYEATFSRAKAERMLQMAAQAQLGMGALHLLDRKPELAASAYLRGAEAAKEAGIALLAIEGYRLAGQALMDMGKEPLAVQAWRSALAIAEQAPAAEAKASSAAETARALAAICRKHGLAAQASALEAQSLQLEQGEASPPQGKAVAR
jgi:tetratricopeptide (TPR) repeat protein